MTAPAGRRLAGSRSAGSRFGGWLSAERPLARVRPAAAAVGALSAGVLVGWLAMRSGLWNRGAADTGGYAVVLAAMAVPLAAGNSYGKAYSP